MGKILLYVAIGLTFASAVLGFLNRGKLAEKNADVAKLQADIADIKAVGAKAAGEVTALKAQVTEATTAKDQATAALTTAQSDTQKAAQQLLDLQKQAGEKDTQIAQLTQDNEAKQAKLQELTTATPTAAPSAELTAQLIEQQKITQSLMDKIKTTEEEVTVLRKRNDNRIARSMQKGLEGTILAVNPAWNFVILSLGDRNGVVNNSEMLIKRGTQLVGKVRITQVDPTSSIADIVANSVPRGINVQPGDKVIYQGSSEDEQEAL